MSLATTQPSSPALDGYTHYLSVRYRQADRFTSFFLWGYFALGIVLALYYNTWLLALGVGGACMAAHLLCTSFLAGTLLSRMVTSLAFSIFMLQFIAQMHGMFEMHFFFFINITILLIYQDWRVIIPYTLLAAVHHITLFGLQLNGYAVSEYILAMDTISYTTVVFHLLLVVFMAVVCIWWSIVLRRKDQEEFESKFQLEKQLENMVRNRAFASEISRGNLAADYQLQQDDALGLSLQEMRSSLQTAARKEEQERYKNVGITEISEILRQHAGNLDELANRLISRLVNYMKINQGGLFLLKEEDNDSWLELIACYAFDRKKYLSKRIEIGEGLVGQAVLEKDTMYITDVPAGYINIGSGLGDARPRSLLIVPLKSSDEAIVGIMEFASFHIFQPHEIEFLEKLAETIASAITTAKVNLRTKLLLQRSQQQAEELRAQEEEMRQNMEELEATQEEMRRKELSMRGHLTAIDNTMATIEFDMQGRIQNANDKFLQTMGYSAGEIRGMHHRKFCEPDYASSPEYSAFWQQLNSGIPIVNDYKRIGKGGKVVWLHASYTPVLDSNGTYVKVIKLAFDITREKLNNLDMQAQIEAINNSNAVIEFTPQGTILRANWIFQDLMQYSLEKMVGKHHRLFLDEKEQASEAYQQHWQKLQEGEILQGEFRRLTSKGDVIWIKGTYNPVLDLSGRVVKVVKVAQDISAEKKLQEKERQHMADLYQ
jgi:methyl-accepting chemotaxis protein